MEKCVIVENMESGSPFINRLAKKLAYTKRVAHETGKNTSAAQREVTRQIDQASKGNIITGEGVTKSGQED